MSESTLMVYQAHPLTGEYTGPTQADPDPLDEGNWLIPAMAFADAPPKPKAGFAIVHTPGADQVWSLVPDHRGMVYQVETGAPLQWEELGPLSDNLTASPYPGPGNRWDGNEWTYDDALAQAGLIAAERAWRDSEIESVKWLRERHRDQQEIGVDPSLSSVQFRELLVYIQALRDWPQTAQFPALDSRPTAPGWIADQSQ